MKSFDSVDNNKLWNILKEMGITDHLTCLLRNLYADQGATVITLHGKTDWFKTWKGVWQAWILSPFLFNLYAEYIMWNARLDDCMTGEDSSWSPPVLLSWTQACQEKYQQPRICRWCHSNGRRWRGTKELLDEGERGEGKSWLKTQHSEN